MGHHRDDYYILSEMRQMIDHAGIQGDTAKLKRLIDQIRQNVNADGGADTMSDTERVALLGRIRLDNVANAEHRTHLLRQMVNILQTTIRDSQLPYVSSLGNFDPRTKGLLFWTLQAISEQPQPARRALLESVAQFIERNPGCRDSLDLQQFAALRKAETDSLSEPGRLEGTRRDFNFLIRNPATRRCPENADLVREIMIEQLPDAIRASRIQALTRFTEAIGSLPAGGEQQQTFEDLAGAFLQVHFPQPAGGASLTRMQRDSLAALCDAVNQYRPESRRQAVTILQRRIDEALPPTAPLRAQVLEQIRSFLGDEAGFPHENTPVTGGGEPAGRPASRPVAVVARSLLREDGVRELHEDMRNIQQYCRDKEVGQLKQTISALGRQDIGAARGSWPHEMQLARVLEAVDLEAFAPKARKEIFSMMITAAKSVAKTHRYANPGTSELLSCLSAKLDLFPPAAAAKFAEQLYTAFAEGLRSHQVSGQSSVSLQAAAINLLQRDPGPDPAAALLNQYRLVGIFDNILNPAAERNEAASHEIALQRVRTARAALPALLQARCATADVKLSIELLRYIAKTCPPDDAKPLCDAVLDQLFNTSGTEPDQPGASQASANDVDLQRNSLLLLQALLRKPPSTEIKEQVARRVDGLNRQCPQSDSRYQKSLHQLLSQI
ncbi:hypothetical protein [Martelella alba]|nr:hypothetical protein [Martelella alba]